MIVRVLANTSEDSDRLSKLAHSTHFNNFIKEKRERARTVVKTGAVRENPKRGGETFNERLF